MISIDPDYELRSSKRRARKKSGRAEVIDVNRARQLYDELGTWRAVSEKLLRKSGQRFTPQAIFVAVRWADQGFAGGRI